METYVDNNKAYYNYEISERFEAGIVLLGSEVKSIRTGKATLQGSYVVIKDNEAYLIGASIAPYQPNNTSSDYDPQRSRKLLLKRSEIEKLIGKTKEKGQALIPLKLFGKSAKIKLEFGIGKGKKKTDKRQTIKKRESDIQIERELKSRG